MTISKVSTEISIYPTRISPFYERTERRERVSATTIVANIKSIPIDSDHNFKLHKKVSRMTLCIKTISFTARTIGAAHRR